MRDALQSYLSLAGGLTEVTRQRALAAAKALAAQGEATAEQVQSLAEDLLSQTRQNSEAVTALVRYEVERALGRLGLASGDDVTHLLGRVQALEEQVPSLRVSGETPTASLTKAPAKAAPVKKATPAKPPGKKTPAKSVGQKSVGKKSVGKKSAGKKAPARASEAPTTAPETPPSTASAASPTSGS